MEKKADFTLDLDRDLVPLALETSKELLEQSDNKTKAEVAKDILNRSSQYAPRKDGGPSVSITIDNKVFTDALGKIGSMMGGKTVRDVTPEPEQVEENTGGVIVPKPTNKKISSFEEIEG